MNPIDSIHGSGSKAVRRGDRRDAGLKAARVCYNTVRAHERNDPEFAAQLKAAEQEGVEMLHAVCWKSAVEGNVEPVYFQGQIVGHIRKYDSRMQIELLRAHMPHLFKTPGSHAPVISGDNNKGVIIDAETRAELVRLRREALEAMNPKQIQGAPNGAATDSGHLAGFRSAGPPLRCCPAAREGRARRVALSH
jgi:hypothetical protein